MKEHKEAILRAVEGKIVSIADDDNLQPEMLHYHRGIILGMLVGLKVQGLLSDAEHNDISARLDNITKIKQREHFDWLRAIQRN